MGPSLVWTLGLIFFNAVLCKHAKGVTLNGPEQSLYIRDSVRLYCVQDVQGYLYFYKNQSLLQNDTNHELRRTSNELELTIYSVSTSDQGFYRCRTKEGTQSTKKELKITAKTRRVHLKTSSETIPEQSSVTLSCEVERFKGTYEWFRRNSDSDPQWERMKENSARVSVSDGGVYSCRGWDGYILTSESNTVTVLETAKEHISSFPVIIGLICAIVLLILLLLLWRCRKSKVLCSRSVRTNQRSADDHMTISDDTSPPNDATYSVLELKNINNENVTYAQVNHHRKDKAKRKTKVAEEPLYSEIR